MTGKQEKKRINYQTFLYPLRRYVTKEIIYVYIFRQQETRFAQWMPVFKLEILILYVIRHRKIFYEL